MKHVIITTAKPINPVDLHVGGRVRVRRKFMGLSQEDLAGHIGLTFQQVQKYERGSNRISASKLYEIAQALKCGIGYFFEGYSAERFEGDEHTPDTVISATEGAVHAFLMTTEGVALASTFPGIRSAKQCRRILELVETLAEDAE